MAIAIAEAAVVSNPTAMPEMIVVAGPVFEDNVKPWSGDHSVDPRLVPGVFFCNRAIDGQEPALVDIAPTALRLFGIEPPRYMDGRPLAGLA